MSTVKVYMYMDFNSNEGGGIVCTNKNPFCSSGNESLRGKNLPLINIDNGNLVDNLMCNFRKSKIV